MRNVVPRPTLLSSSILYRCAPAPDALQRIIKPQAAAFFLRRIKWFKDAVDAVAPCGMPPPVSATLTQTLSLFSPVCSVSVPPVVIACDAFFIQVQCQHLLHLPSRRWAMEVSVRASLVFTVMPRFSISGRSSSKVFAATSFQ